MTPALYRAIRTLPDEALGGAIAVLAALTDDDSDLNLTEGWEGAWAHVERIREVAEAERRIRDEQLGGSGVTAEAVAVFEPGPPEAQIEQASTGQAEDPARADFLEADIAVDTWALALRPEPLPIVDPEADIAYRTAAATNAKHVEKSGSTIASPTLIKCEGCSKEFEQPARPYGGRRRKYCDDCRDARKVTDKAASRGDPLKATATEGGHAATQELLDRFRSGDREALVELRERYADPVASAIVSFAGKVDTEAVIRETWATWKESKFEGFAGSSLLAWMRVVARNRCIDLLRASSAPGAGQVLEAAADGQAPEAQDIESGDMGDKEPAPENLEEEVPAPRPRRAKPAPAPVEPVDPNWVERLKAQAPKHESTKIMAPLPPPSGPPRGHCQSCGRIRELAIDGEKRWHCRECGSRWVTPVIGEGIDDDGRKITRLAPAGWAVDEDAVNSRWGGADDGSWAAIEPEGMRL